MNLSSVAATTLCALALLSHLHPLVWQSAATPTGSSSEVSITTLAKPVYPPIGQQLHIQGDVEVSVTVSKDGTAQSASIVSGPPLLSRSASESAMLTRYECKNCGDAGGSIRIVFSFKLTSDAACNDAPAHSTGSQIPEHYPQITQSLNHVTIIGQLFVNCNGDVMPTKRSRSLKCLYLWRCGQLRYSL